MAGAESNNTNLVKLDEEYIGKLEEQGVIFVESDTAAFNELTAPVYGEFPEWSEGIHATIMQELGKIRAGS